MEFWQDWVIDKSFQILQELKKKYRFILIGGWAVYFLTRILKSKDIDIIVDFEELEKMKIEMNIGKTEFLRKYSAEIEGISIDIYVPYYSKLAIPVEEIKKHVLTIEGFSVPRGEIVLILKQQAEIERGKSVKGIKDRTDILSLLIFSSIDFDLYMKLLERYDVLHYRDRLKEIVKKSDVEFRYLGISNPRKKKKIKETLLRKLNQNPISP